MLRGAFSGLRRLSRVELVRDSAPLAVGSALSQGSLLLATPVILYLYGAEAFGLFATVMATAAIVSGVTALRIDAVIPFIARRYRALRLVAAVVAIIGVATFAEYAVLAATVVCCGGPVAWFGPTIGLIVAWVPFIVFGQALFVAARSWVVRSRSFSLVMIAQVSRTFVFIALAIGIGHGLSSGTSLAVNGLLFAQASADLVGLCSIVARLPAGERRLMLPWPYHRALSEFRANFRFITATSISSLLAMLNTAIPLWTIGSTFGLQAAGWFSAAQRIIFAPTQVTLDTIGVAFNQRLRDKLGRGRPILSDLLRLILANTVLLAPALAVLAWLAQGQRLGFLGPDWSRAGPTLSVMVVIGFGLTFYSAVEGIPSQFQLNYYLVSSHAARSLAMLAIAAVALAHLVTHNTWLHLYAVCEMLLYGGNAIILLAYVARRERTMPQLPAAQPPP